MRRKITWIGGTAATALSLAACGGSSGLSKAQLGAKVNPVCRSFVAQVKAIPVPPDFVQNPAHAATYLGQLVAIVQKGTNEVAALKPDSSVKSQFDSYVQSLKHEVALLKSAQAAAQAKNPAGLQTLNQESAYNKTTVKPAASALGFSSCA
jgi:hypothetical protein